MVCCPVWDLKNMGLKSHFISSSKMRSLQALWKALMRTTHVSRWCVLATVMAQHSQLGRMHDGLSPMVESYPPPRSETFQISNFLKSFRMKMKIIPDLIQDPGYPSNLISVCFRWSPKITSTRLEISKLSTFHILPYLHMHYMLCLNIRSETWKFPLT